MAGCGAAAMAENAKESFEECINSAFPIDGKPTRSAVIRRSLAQRITAYLKGTPDSDKAFRHFVKKSSFQLLDLPAAGVRDVLVVSVKEEKQVSCQQHVV